MGDIDPTDDRLHYGDSLRIQYPTRKRMKLEKVEKRAGFVFDREFDNPLYTRDGCVINGACLDRESEKVYLSDSKFHCIISCSMKEEEEEEGNDGQCRWDAYGGRIKGSGPLEFDTPGPLAWCQRRKVLLVADLGNERIKAMQMSEFQQVFTLQGFKDVRSIVLDHDNEHLLIEREQQIVVSWIVPELVSWYYRILLPGAGPLGCLGTRLVYKDNEFSRFCSIRLHHERNAEPEQTLSIQYYKSIRFLDTFAVDDNILKKSLFMAFWDEEGSKVLFYDNDNTTPLNVHDVNVKKPGESQPQFVAFFVIDSERLCFVCKDGKITIYSMNK